VTEERVGLLITGSTLMQVEPLCFFPWSLDEDQKGSIPLDVKGDLTNLEGKKVRVIGEVETRQCGDLAPRFVRCFKVQSIAEV
jgi:hypothetical protein